LDGKKKYELRLADWECKEDDELVLREWDPEKKEHTGREIVKKVDMVLKTKDLDFWSEEEKEKFGFQIISFKE